MSRPSASLGRPLTQILMQHKPFFAVLLPALHFGLLRLGLCCQHVVLWSTHQPLLLDLTPSLPCHPFLSVGLGGVSSDHSWRCPPFPWLPQELLQDLTWEMPICSFQATGFSGQGLVNFVISFLFFKFLFFNEVTGSIFLINGPFWPLTAMFFFCTGRILDQTGIVRQLRLGVLDAFLSGPLCFSHQNLAIVLEDCLCCSVTLSSLDWCPPAPSCWTYSPKIAEGSSCRWSVFCRMFTAHPPLTKAAVW